MSCMSAKMSNNLTCYNLAVTWYIAWHIVWKENLDTFGVIAVHWRRGHCYLMRNKKTRMLFKDKRIDDSIKVQAQQISFWYSLHKTLCAEMWCAFIDNLTKENHQTINFDMKFTWNFITFYMMSKHFLLLSQAV